MTVVNIGGGRRVPPRPTFTFSSGVTVELDRVGPMFYAQIVRRYPAPVPPLQKVEIAPNVWSDEPNPHDPTHEEALRQHQAKVAEAIQDAMLEVAIRDDLDIDDKLVAKLRRGLGESAAGMSDRLIYIKYVLVSTPADIENLLKTVQAMNSPSEEAVTAHAESFRGAV